MERRITALLMLALAVLPGTIILGLVEAVPLTLQIDKGYYIPGEKVMINGTASSNANVTILIESRGEAILNITVQADEGGSYSYNFTLPSDSLPGRYDVRAVLGDETAEASFTVALTESRELAERLIEMANRSRILAEEAFEELEYRNLTIPADASQSYSEGVQLLEEAQTLFNEGNYSAAIDVAFEALKRFTEALQEAHRVAPPRPVERLEELERAIGLRVAIERANDTLKRIDGTLTLLSSYINMTLYSMIESRIEDAKEHLENALAKLEAGDVSGAANELASARGIIGRLTGLINSAAGRLKAMRALRLMERMEEQVRSLERGIIRLRLRLTEREAASCLEALRNVKSKLARVRELLEQGDIEGASEGLEEASEMVERGIGNLERRELNQFLREVNRLEARIRSLRSSLEALEKRGLSLSEVEERLDEAEGLLNEAMGLMEGGGEAGEPLKKAEGLIEEAEELLQSLTLPRGLALKGGWPPQKGKGKRP